MQEQSSLRGGGPGPFNHINDVSVYLGRQRAGGVPDQKNTFCARVLCFETGAVHFSLCEHSKLEGRNYKISPQACFVFQS